MRISWKDYVLHGVCFTVYGLFKYIPSPIGNWLRYLVIKLFIAKIGRVRVAEGVTFWYPYRIEIGSNTTLNEFVYLNGFGGLKIGSFVRIGHHVSIFTSDHNFSDPNRLIKDQGLSFAETVIEDDVFIGAGAYIMKGVRIGRGSIVGTAAVVTKSVPPFSIVAGNPARIIRSRLGEAITRST